jgi:hypothetical protein
MDLGTIRQKTLDFLREQSTPVGVTSAEINRYINDGYVEIAETTQAVVEEIQLTVGGGEHFLALPGNSLAPLTFVDDTSGYPIRPVHWTWIDRRDFRWIRISRQRPRLYAAFGLKEIFFYPAYNSTSTVTMNHAVVPQSGFTTDLLVNNTDIPELPEQHHMALSFYANYRALLKDADGPKLGRAMRQRKYYQNTLDGVGIWSVERHETLKTAVYGVSKHSPSTIAEFG